MYNKKNILITGGTGSFGQEFASYLLKNYKPKKIIIYSRDEHKQYVMQSKNIFSKQNILRFFIGDIRDLDRLKFATRDVDIIVHAAALKHVTAAEYNPFEFIKTNIIGAQNVIECALFNNVEKTIALSTDKASSPINLYGATKLCSDKLFISANNYKGNKNVAFSVVRYGNVLGSNGSVLPIFINQAKNKTLKITDKEMTRFNITLEEGANFVSKALQFMHGGEIFIPKLKSYYVTDMAKAVSYNSKIVFTGVRPGEKIHEEMISESESRNCVEYSNYYIIRPETIYNNWNLNDFNKKNRIKNIKLKKENLPYRSNTNTNFLKIKDLKKIILPYL